MSLINPAQISVTNNSIPLDNSLGNNYPDPFANSTIIPYTLIDGAKGRIIIKDILGRPINEIDVLSDNNKRE